MKAYVASKFSRLVDVRRVVEKLRAIGVEVNADWTDHSAAGRVGTGLLEYLRSCAEADREGVRTADVLVMVHDPASRGGFVEFGMAAGLGKTLVVIGGRLDYPDRAPIFYVLPEVHHFEDEDAAVAWFKMLLTKYAARTREQEVQPT